jgi:hypothetical protein
MAASISAIVLMIWSLASAVGGTQLGQRATSDVGDRAGDLGRAPSPPPFRSRYNGNDGE